jgi:hypothetical protein
MCKSGVCDGALKNAHELKNVTISAASAFLPLQVSDKMMHYRRNIKA